MTTTESGTPLDLSKVSTPRTARVTMSSLHVFCVWAAFTAIIIAGCDQVAPGTRCVEWITIPKYESPVISEVDGRIVRGEPEYVGDKTLCVRADWIK